MYEPSSLIREIPKPEVVAQHLGVAVREAAVLRKLLKLSKQAEAERQFTARAAELMQARGREVNHAVPA